MLECDTWGISSSITLMYLPNGSFSRSLYSQFTTKKYVCDNATCPVTSVVFSNVSGQSPIGVTD